MVSSKKISGTSLIEALVAMVILSLGLLGLAGLQINAIRTADGAHHRAQAAQLAYDMADRMRANRTKARAGAYNLLLSEGELINGIELHDKDRADWLAQLSALLPSGDASIDVPANSDTVTITIQWNDTRLGGPANATLTLQTQL